MSGSLRGFRIGRDKFFENIDRGRDQAKREAINACVHSNLEYKDEYICIEEVQQLDKDVSDGIETYRKELRDLEEKQKKEGE